MDGREKRKRQRKGKKNLEPENHRASLSPWPNLCAAHRLVGLEEENLWHQKRKPNLPCSDFSMHPVCSGSYYIFNANVGLCGLYMFYTPLHLKGCLAQTGPACPSFPGRPCSVRQPLHWNNVITSAALLRCSRAHISAVLQITVFSSYDVKISAFQHSLTRALSCRAPSSCLRAFSHLTLLSMILIPSLITRCSHSEQSCLPLTLGLQACGSRAHFH